VYWGSEGHSPGRARLAAKPCPTGSGTLSITIGVLFVALFAVRVVPVQTVTISVEIHSLKLVRENAKPLSIEMPVAAFDDEVLALDVTVVAQPGNKWQVLGADLNRSESRIAFRALDCCQCRKGTFLAIRLSICRSKPVIERHSAAS